MSATTSTLTAVTKFVRARLEAVPIDQPTQKYVCQLINQIYGFASHLSSSKWGWCHSHISLVLYEAKMRLVNGDSNLDCAHITTPERINPAITDTTTGRALLQLQ